jgi:hypothetical protein
LEKERWREKKGEIESKYHFCLKKSTRKSFIFLPVTMISLIEKINLKHFVK